MIVFELSRDQWSAKIRENPSLRECVFLTPEYIDCWARHEAATPVCLFLESSSSRYLYPFLIKPIAPVGSGHAIHSVYGYGGLTRASCDTQTAVPGGACLEELRQVNRAIDQWCANRGVVSEFVRQQHFLSDGAHFRDLDYSVARYDLLTLLHSGWRDLLPAHAWRPLKRAREQGLVPDVLPLAAAVSEFHALYLETMTRIGATQYYRFPESYFSSLARSFGEQALLVCVWASNGALAGAGLVLASGRTAVFHLAATRRTGAYRGVSDLLYFEVLCWAECNGFDQVLLGGGMTTRADDSLYSFKSKFATIGRPFHIGRKVHDPTAHALLRERWLSANSERAEAMKNVFQCYLF